MIIPEQAALLKTNIEATPALAAHLAAGNDNAIANYYNSTKTTVVGLVEKASVQALLQEFSHVSGMPVWLLIVDTAANVAADPNLRVACRMVLAAAEATYTNIDLGKPAVKVALDVLLAATYLTQEQRNALDAIASRPVTYAQDLLSQGVGFILTTSDISFALRGVR